MEIPKNLKNDIWEYCRVNDIPNIYNFTIKILQQGFTIEKYGETPYTDKPKEIIKEIEVIKEVFVTDNEKTHKLIEELNTLKLRCDETKKVQEQTIDKLEKEIIKLKLVIEANSKDIYGES